MGIQVKFYFDYTHMGVLHVCVHLQCLVSKEDRKGYNPGMKLQTVVRRCHGVGGGCSVAEEVTERRCSVE